MTECKYCGEQVPDGQTCKYNCAPVVVKTPTFQEMVDVAMAVVSQDIKLQASNWNRVWKDHEERLKVLEGKG